jgi:HEPN domain-containing protein
MKTYRDWILKADHDLKIAKDEMKEREAVTDMVCFHCQQAVEKILKAFLISKNKEVAKTHDLSFLISECIKIDSEFKELFDKGIDLMGVYAVEMRYPGDMYIPSLEEAKDAISKAEYVKDFVMRKLESER